MAKWRSNRHQGKRLSALVLVLFVLVILTVVLFVLLGLVIVFMPVGSGDDSSPIGGRVKLKRMILNTWEGEGEGLGKRGNQWTEVLSWEPRTFIYHNFLSKEECAYLIHLAKPHIKKSSVVDSNTGKRMDSRARTSTGTFLRRGQDKVIRDIEKRIADYTFIPVCRARRRPSSSALRSVAKVRASL